MSMAPEDRGDAGFALLSVIGAIGIIAVIMTAFIAAAGIARSNPSRSPSAPGPKRSPTHPSTRRSPSFSFLVSRGGVESERPGLSGLSTSCASSDGTAVRVTVTHESGKVDLNTAQADLVAALIRGIVRDGQTRAVVRDILSLRGSRAGRKPQPAFESALQIGQIPGIGRREFEALLTLVTVHSGSPGLNARLASAEVLNAVSEHGNPAEAQRRNAAFFLADVPGRSFRSRRCGNGAWDPLHAHGHRRIHPRKPVSFRNPRVAGKLSRFAPATGAERSPLLRCPVTPRGCGRRASPVRCDGRDRGSGATRRGAAGGSRPSNSSYHRGAAFPVGTPK